MKQACGPRRRGNRAAWLILALLVVLPVLASCGKPKPAATPAAPSAQQPAPAPGAPPAYTHEGGISITTQPASSLPGRIVQKAIGEKCIEYLRQLRMAIDIYQQDNGSYPPDLATLSGVGRMTACPVGRQPYVYNPTTGEVHCTFPGHEKY